MKEVSGCSLRSAILLLVLLLAAGCGARAADSVALVEASVQRPAPTPAPPAPTIALVMKTLTNPFFVHIEQGARLAEEELDVRLVVKAAAQETSVDQQIAIVESLIAARVDAIVIAPADSVGMVPVLKQAQDAGIAIVNIDNRLDAEQMARAGLAGVPFISVDNEDGAYRAARAISQDVTAPTQAAIIEGIRSARNAADRRAGALRAFGENPNITVVASETAHWKIDEGYSVARALFRQHPDIALIFCANDMMALGALRYLAESGRDGVRVAGFDALSEAREAIRSGALMATVDQQAARQGYLGVQYAVRLLAGDQPPAETLLPAVLVTRESLP